MAPGSTDRQSTVSIPGQATFSITDAALEMVGVFGGSLHCYQGAGGCHAQGLYFSRTRPKKFLAATLDAPAAVDQGISITVSHELAARLEGAVLDFGNHNRMQRFIWAAMPAAKGPLCTCRRSMGKPSGKRATCLDDIGTGLTDL